MANIFTVKNSSTAGKVPTAADLEQAELAVNLADKKIFTKDGGNAVVELPGWGLPYHRTEQTVAPAGGVVDFDVSKGRNILFNVTGAVTAVTITDPSGIPTGAIEIKLTTDGSHIEWTGFLDWVGAKPDKFPAGVHVIRVIKLDGAWYARYEGAEIPSTIPFKMTVRTAAPSEAFDVPLGTGTVNCQVDWGDGKPPSALASATDPNKLHTYDVAGDYQIVITGQIDNWGFNASTSAPKVISVDAWGDIGFINLDYGFKGCTNLVSVAAGDITTTGDTTKITSLWETFLNCTSLKSIGVFDTHLVTRFNSTFFNSGITVLPKFDFSAAKNLSAMCRGCTSLVSFLPTDFPLVTNASNLCHGCVKLSSFPFASFPLCTSFSSAWLECKSLQSFPLIDFSKGVRFDQTWMDCTALTSFPPIDITDCTILSQAWHRCSSLISFPSLTGGTKVTNCGSAWRSTTSMITWNKTDFPICTDFSSAWWESGITHFPVTNMSKGVKFVSTWYGCKSLLAFPDINFAEGTTFSQAWQSCISMVDFQSYRFPKVTNLQSAWYTCSNLVTQRPPVMPLVENLAATWRICPKLETTFALFLAKVKFDAVTNLTSTFFEDKKLTGPFPMKVTSAVTDMGGTFCRSGLDGAFPLIDTSKVTAFQESSLGAGCWQGTQITSIPNLDFSGVTVVTGMSSAFRNCGALTTFPPNRFDSIPPTVNIWTWIFNATNLTLASKKNILTSWDVSGIISTSTSIMSGGAALDPAADALVATLVAKGWTAGTIT